ncbi:MAG: hypothetical protein JW829_11975 [Pirellulales bacterium]|nr:hypothetical protein [Pirellulales bacterium]
MSENQNDGHFRCGCCGSLDRRDFMTGVGLSALAVPGLTGMFSAARVSADTGTATASDPPARNGKPHVHAAFLHPKMDRYWMGWPGASYDIAARQADYKKTMVDAAESMDVDLEVIDEPVAKMADIDAFLAQCEQSKPDGVILTVMGLHPNYWPHAEKFLDNRGEIPTIIFAPMGVAFTGHLQPTRKAKHCFVASTQDIGWLATGMRMLRTMWDMKTSRLCIINGDQTQDQQLNVIGTTLHHIPLNRWTDELAKQETTSEVEQLANEFRQTAKGSVEPKPQDLVNAAKAYYVGKKIMADEHCDGISLNCLGLIGQRKIPCPPCMAWMKFNNEGSVGCCECDWKAAISLRLCSLLIRRPGFMQDPVPNTVRGTFMGAHCSSPSKLRGFDQAAEPVILRSHSESGLGVSPQVLWPVGESTTVMWFQEPDKIVLGTGKVVANIDTPPSGGCRTSVELEMDNVADPRDCKGFHQPFILGKWDRLVKAYCQLAGIEVLPIA